MSRRVLTDLSVDGDIELSGDIIYGGLSILSGPQQEQPRTYADLKVKPVGFIPVVIEETTYHVPFYS